MALTTKPRWDKYDAYVGNFRGHLAADIDVDDYNQVVGCGLNGDGAIVVGAGTSGLKGLMIVAVGTDMNGDPLGGGINNKAGDPQDVGKHGEITNFRPYDITKEPDDPTQPVPAAGTNYYVYPNGSVLATDDATATYCGHTVEASRLVVNFSDVPDGKL